jgi:membrane protein required for colicin V production
MTLFDYAVLTIIGLSVLLGVVRGFVREVLALAGWAVAFVVASLFSADFAGLLVKQIAEESWRVLAAFVSVVYAHTGCDEHHRVAGVQADQKRGAGR